jgi:hypothetical protein
MRIVRVRAMRIVRVRAMYGGEEGGNDLLVGHALE